MTTAVAFLSWTMRLNIRGAPGDACSKRNGYQVRGAGTGEEASGATRDGTG